MENLHTQGIDVPRLGLGTFRMRDKTQLQETRDSSHGHGEKEFVESLKR